MNKNSISGCTYFFFTGNPNTWFPETHSHTQIWTLFEFVNTCELLDASYENQNLVYGLNWDVQIHCNYDNNVFICLKTSIYHTVAMLMCPHWLKHF